MNKLPKIILVLFGIAILQTNCAQVGKFIEVFESVQDSILVVDKLFFSSPLSAKGCFDYQIFCDWFYVTFLPQNNLQNVIIYDLTITKTNEYMFFIKKGGSASKRRNLATKSYCGEYDQICDFLESYEDYEDLSEEHNKYTNQSETILLSEAYSLEKDK